MTGLLELAGVTKSFVLPTGERLDILRGLDLTVGAGEVTAIVGRSGSGKTTLLNLLGLLDTPTSGTLRCNGLDIARMGDAKRSRLRGEFLGFIFQQFHLLDRRTAVENVAEPLLFGTRRDVGRRKTRAHALLDQVGLSDRAHSMPHLLSGGEQQRVAIARALVRSPRVVLADEPTGALDEATGERVLDLLFDLARAEGVALVVVTHDPAVADRADRVLTLAGGRLHDGAAERPVVIGDVIAAWLDVRTKPLRTLAAIAGMVAAVVAVVLVDAAGVLSREANDTYLARQYGLSVTASIFSESGQSAAAQAALLEATLRDNGIVALSPDVNLPATVTYGGTVVFHGVRWFSPEYNNIRIVDLVAGAWPSDTANSDVLHVVLNEGWAQEALGLTDKQAIGQVLGYSTGLTASFDVKSTPVKPMIVDAVVSTATNAFASGSSPVAVVTALSHPDLLGNVTAMSWVARVHPRDYGFLQELVASVTDEQGRPVYRTARADEGDQLAPVLSQQSVTARVVTIVALTIGGLGILGVGIASVRERAKDFGLRRALGASKLRIFAGVIVQTLMEVLLAAVIAIPLAAILLELFARDMVLESLPLPPSTSLPLGSAMQGLAGALIVGLVAGLVPAISAARASVVQALRG